MRYAFHLKAAYHVMDHVFGHQHAMHIELHHSPHICIYMMLVMCSYWTIYRRPCSVSELRLMRRLRFVCRHQIPAENHLCLHLDDGWCISFRSYPKIHFGKCPSDYPRSNDIDASWFAFGIYTIQSAHGPYIHDDAFSTDGRRPYIYIYRIFDWQWVN